jgi:hypothetical protein
VHVAIEGGTNGLDHLRARAFVCVLQRHADRAESCEVADQLPLRQRAGDVDWPKLDAAPPAVSQDSPTR